MSVPLEQREAEHAAAVKAAQQSGNHQLVRMLAGIDPTPGLTLQNKDAEQNFREEVARNSGLWPTEQEILNYPGLNGTSRLKLLQERRQALNANPNRKRDLTQATSQLRKDVDTFLGNQILSGKVHSSTVGLTAHATNIFQGKYDIYTAVGSNLTPDAAFQKALKETQDEIKDKFNDPTSPLYVQTTRNGQPITPVTPNLGTSPISSYISEYNQAKQQHGTKDVLSSHMFFSPAEADQIQRAYSNTGPMIPASLRRKASWLADKEGITSLEVFRRQLQMHGLDLTPQHLQQVSYIQQTNAIAQNNPAYLAMSRTVTNMLNKTWGHPSAVGVILTNHQPGSQNPWRDPNNISSSVNLAIAARNFKGSSTKAGPDGGRNACVWSVNKVFQQAGKVPPWGTSNWVPNAEKSMIQKGWSEVSISNRRPGDIMIMYDNKVPPQAHIGIVLSNRKVLSNSSRRGSFTWEDTPEGYNAYYGARGRIYREPSFALEV